MSNKRSPPRSLLATSSSPTISATTRSPVRETIGARGAGLLCLLPYSPDLNPIEKVFAKLKALLRKIAARTVARL
jgi:transposase